MSRLFVILFLLSFFVFSVDTSYALKRPEERNQLKNPYPIAPMWHKYSHNDDLYDQCRRLYFDEKYTKAYSLCIGIAREGDPRAQFGVGQLYENGFGVDKSYKTAAEWYTKAAEGGSLEAKQRLRTYEQYKKERQRRK